VCYVSHILFISVTVNGGSFTVSARNLNLQGLVGQFCVVGVETIVDIHAISLSLSLQNHNHTTVMPGR
jgi:hypothetical protein